MPAVLADVTVDDVEFALCAGCREVYALLDGWLGHCPSCCALVDEHDAGRHDFIPVLDCRTCDDVDEQLDLGAIA